MKRVILILFVLFSVPSFGQKQVNKHSGVWLGYFNQTRISDKWGFWLDLYARRTDFLDRWATQIIRPGITYYANDDLRFTAGMLTPAAILRLACTQSSLKTGFGNRNFGQAARNACKPSSGSRWKSALTTKLPTTLCRMAII